MPCHLSHLLKFTFHQDKFSAAQIERIFANLADLSCNEKRALRTARKLKMFPYKNFGRIFKRFQQYVYIYIYIYIYISKEQICGNTIAQYRKRIS